MYQVNCQLRMDNVRHARYRLLIESCRQFDPAKLAQVREALTRLQWPVMCIHRKRQLGTAS